MEIGQFTWSRQTVVLSERDESGSEKEIFLTQNSFGGSLEPFTPMDFLCQSSDESHCKPGCSQLDVGDVVSNLLESNAAAVTNFSFEGHCTKTNANEANEVQENVVTLKKRKKRGIKAITSFLVNNASVAIQNSDSFCFTTRVGGKMSRGNIYCIVLLLLSAIVSAPLSPVTIKAATSFLDSRQ